MAVREIQWRQMSSDRCPEDITADVDKDGGVARIGAAFGAYGASVEFAAEGSFDLNAASNGSAGASKVETSGDYAPIQVSTSGEHANIELTTTGTDSSVVADGYSGNYFRQQWDLTEANRKVIAVRVPVRRAVIVSGSPTIGALDDDYLEFSAGSAYKLQWFLDRFPFGSRLIGVYFSIYAATSLTKVDLKAQIQKYYPYTTGGPLDVTENSSVSLSFSGAGTKLVLAQYVDPTNKFLEYTADAPPPYYPNFDNTDEVWLYNLGGYATYCNSGTVGPGSPSPILWDESSFSLNVEIETTTDTAFLLQSVAAGYTAGCRYP